jgi:small-conductance mechanosensitive channel
MRSITKSDAAGFFGKLGRESFRTEPHLSGDEQALIDGPLFWEIVSDDSQPKLKRRLQTVSHDSEEARSSAKRPNISQEMQLAIVPEQQPGKRSKREHQSGASSDAAEEEVENSEIIGLLKQLLTRVDRMERSIADVQGSVEKQDSNVVDMKESIAKLLTTVDEIKSQLLPSCDKSEQPSVPRSVLKTPTSSKKVRFVETESTHKPSSSSSVTAKCKKIASKKKEENRRPNIFAAGRRHGSCASSVRP